MTPHSLSFGARMLRNWGDYLQSETALLAFFRGLLACSTLALGLAILGMFAAGYRELHRYAITGVMGVLIAICWGLSKKRPQGAVKLFLIGMWLSISVNNSLVAGLQSPNVMLYPFLIALGGSVLGPRWLLGLTLSSLLVVLAQGLIQTFGGWEPIPAVGMLPRTVMYCVTLLITSVLVYAAWSSFQAAVRRANGTAAELEQRNTALQRSEQDIQLLMDSVPAFIAAFDASKRLRRCNLGLAQLFGFADGSELVGQTMEQLLGPADWPIIEPHWRQAYAGQTATYRHTPQDPRKSKVQVLDVVLVPQWVNGTVTGVFTLATDVTHQVETEAAIRQLNASLEEKVLSRTRELQATVEKLQHSQDELGRSGAKATLSMLAASLAHELDAPLSNSGATVSALGSVLTDLQIQLEATDLQRPLLVATVARQQSALTLLERNIEHAAALVRQFQQVANDQVSENRRSFDLGIAVREVLATLTPSLKGPHRVEVNLPERVLLDSYPGALGQVVVNLVNNAFLHAFEGMSTGVLKISADRVDDQIRLQFADNGIGMSEEVRNRLFEPFFSTKQGQGNPGLGLHIVRSVVERTLGGRVNVTSIPRATSAQLQGTTLTVTLPVQAPQVG
ncbi:sensor histidine kinase [Inhella gelatinilytica]|uniref:histidine kinase n=1 Tax=Inhella gelatinilytica TaxID=2795030 RepID=A0A931ND10_9BURK|nr:PAS domain-containing sensor histidine kinase [Inhella gelatinilytica]MBH9551765.1 PAS domain-containing protein [Inhella gelatinilytica]